MQICKNKNIYKVGFFITLLVFFNFKIFATDMDLLEMPEMPSMPVISIDGTFYKPTIPDKMIEKKQEEKVTVQDIKGDMISSGADTDDLLQSIIASDSTLTAGDLSSLYNSGLFSDLTSLGSSIGGNNSNYLTTTSTNIILQNILNELNELKQEQKKATPEKKEEQINNEKDSVNFKQRNPSVLRFKINGYDIKESLVEVFLSAPEDDGTFLLTADRRYVANNKTRTETFYLLFKPEKNAGASVSYRVLPTVAQDYKNENSFIYKMSQISDLKAEKTGNLVVLRHNQKDFSIDLLLDIDKR